MKRLQSLHAQCDVKHINFIKKWTILMNLVCESKAAVRQFFHAVGEEFFFFLKKTLRVSPAYCTLESTARTVINVAGAMRLLMLLYAERPRSPVAA